MTATVLVHVGTEFNNQTRIEFFATPCALTTQALKECISLVQCQIVGNCVFSASVVDDNNVYVDGYIEVRPAQALETAQTICRFLDSLPEIHVQVVAADFSGQFVQFEQLSCEEEQAFIAQNKAMAYCAVDTLGQNDQYKFLH